MKRLFILFVIAFMMCFAMGIHAQNPDTDAAVLKEGTGRIAKIDPKSRTITVEDFQIAIAVEPAPGDAVTAETPAQTTRSFKYSERTAFASSNPESMDGRMSDLKIGDSVSVQFDDQNNIVRIQEIAPAQQ